METAKDLLNRWFQESPRREAALPTKSQSPKTVPPPLDALPQDRPVEEEDKPFFTADELRKVSEYLKFYIEGSVIIGELGGMASRPGLSLSEVKAIANLVHETSEMIRPFEPIVHGFNRLCDKLCDEQRRVAVQCREFINWLDNWILHSKLDRLHIKLDGVMEALERKSEARTTEIISDLERALLGRPQ
jgi:hypothetical protein